MFIPIIRSILGQIESCFHTGFYIIVNSFLNRVKSDSITGSDEVGLVSAYQVVQIVLNTSYSIYRTKFALNIFEA